jgi:tripartite-type tricarboxylate transporter receptor subunit TctC
MNGAFPWRNIRRADMILRGDARMRTGPTQRSVLALIGSLAPAAAFAAYPDRPIKLVVALAPGGPAETAARLFAPYFSERLGKSVVIENRTGASSVVGTESVVRAPPDGYTLLFGSSSSFAVNPAVMKNLRFDVRKDLRLVGLVSYTPHVLVVRAPLAASPASISSTPYRGGGPAVMGLLTGDVDIFINDASTTVENIHAGKLKPLAVASSTRSPLLPQVPTFAELGFPAVVSSSWFGLAAPANTPVDVIGALAAAMPAVFASASYQARLQKLGLEQFSLSPEQSAAFIEAEFDKWAEVARSAGIQVD